MKIENNKYQIISERPAPGPFIGGKGYLVNEFANTCGATVYFSNYQTAWTGFKKIINALKLTSDGKFQNSIEFNEIIANLNNKSFQML